MRATLTTLVLFFEINKSVILANINENSFSYFRTKRQDFNNEGSSSDVDNSVLEVFNQCKCVPHYQCDENGFIITDGTSLLEERLGNTERIVCKGGSYEGFLVCCKTKSNLREPATSGPLIQETTKKPKITTPKTHEGVIDDRPIQQNNNNGGGRKPRKCGTQLPLIDVRIFTGGEEGESVPMNGEFPWLTTIYLKKNADWIFKCAGTLIHPKVILTVNHCVRIYQASDLKVALNPSIDRRPIGTAPHLERNVKEIIKHPEYNSGNLYNDIALLVVDETYDVNNRSLRINIICLRPNKSLDNRRCLVAGWGKEIKSGNMANILKKVEVPLVQRDQCQTMLRLTRLGEYFELNKSFICAGGEKLKDSCKGDGGGPLMCPPDNGANHGMFVAGMVSWGIQCGLENVPGVYTNVANYYDWIVSELSKREIQL